MDQYYSNYNGDWYLFAQSFLNIAELAAREVRVRGGRKYFIDKLIYNEQLYIPIIFNIKHSIEIFLKTLIVTIESDSLKNENRGHDISILFEKFKAKYEKNIFSKIQAVISDAFLKEPDNRYLKIANDYINTFSSEENFSCCLERLQKLVKKYQECQFLNKKIFNVSNSFNDCKNDIFRYPQNSLKSRIDYNSLVNCIRIDDGGDMDEVLNDIKELKDCYGLEFVFFIYNEYKKETAD